MLINDNDNVFEKYVLVLLIIYKRESMFSTIKNHSILGRVKASIFVEVINRSDCPEYQRNFHQFQLSNLIYLRL